MMVMMAVVMSVGHINERNPHHGLQTAVHILHWGVHRRVVVRGDGPLVAGLGLAHVHARREAYDVIFPLISAVSGTGVTHHGSVTGDLRVRAAVVQMCCSEDDVAAAVASFPEGERRAGVVEYGI